MQYYSHKLFWVCALVFGFRNCFTVLYFLSYVCWLVMCISSVFVASYWTTWVSNPNPPKMDLNGITAVCWQWWEIGEITFYISISSQQYVSQPTHNMWRISLFSMLFLIKLVNFPEWHNPFSRKMYPFVVGWLLFYRINVFQQLVHLPSNNTMGRSPFALVIPWIFLKHHSKIHVFQTRITWQSLNFKFS